MSWHLYVRSAEAVLESTKVPSSQEIISLIKRVNPTALQLPEADKEHGYRVKNDLQSLLLENYGEAFHLAPHPCSPEIILIKHNSLPSIDACHASIHALSAKALDVVGGPAPAPSAMPPGKEARGKLKKRGVV